MCDIFGLTQTHAPKFTQHPSPSHSPCWDYYRFCDAELQGQRRCNKAESARSAQSREGKTNWRINKFCHLQLCNFMLWVLCAERLSPSPSLPLSLTPLFHHSTRNVSSSVCHVCAWTCLLVCAAPFCCPCSCSRYSFYSFCCFVLINNTVV